MEKENNIKISIMIPVYNTSKFLEKCLRSIMVQSLKEIEIICVNDGSTDSSLKILEKLAKEDKRILIITKENGGLTTARNTALKKSQGKYCLNIDSDDWIGQGYLEDIYKRAEKDDLDITISNIIFDFINKPEKNYIVNDLDINDEKIITGKDYIEIFFNGNGRGYTCNKLIKRELYIKNNLWYDEEIFLLEDVEILMMLSYYAKKIGKLNKAYYHYIQGENNGSQKKKVAGLYDISICMNKLTEFYSQHNENEIVNLIKQDKYIHLLSRIVENDYLEKEKYKEFILKFIKELKEEKEITFQKKLLKDKYKLFLITIFKILKISNVNFGIFIIKIARNIIFLRGKLR